MFRLGIPLVVSPEEEDAPSTLPALKPEPDL